MKNLLLITLLYLCISTLSSAQELKLTGNIGGYDIEMILDSADYNSGEFSGKYRYLSQKNFLDIRGQNLDSIIYIEELYNDNQTGTFYLEIESGTFNGVWVNEDNTKSYDVELFTENDNFDFIKAKSLGEFQGDCSDAVSGTYKINRFFINDFFVTKDNPCYELGYNGGEAIFEELEDGSLKFEINLVCGPTYHIAYAEGIAIKQGDIYIYSANEWETDENCEITFKFDKKSVYASSSSSFACGFGARAYMDHSLIKVED